MEEQRNFEIKVKAYNDGQSIPSVDPEDLRRTWEYDRTHSRVGANGCEWLAGRRAVCSQGADVDDVAHRYYMIELLALYGDGRLIAPWKHGDELDAAVFRIAAEFPLLFLEHKSYKLPGDYRFPFDLNAFLRQLVKETGIKHEWEEIPIRVSDGGRCFGYSHLPGAGNPDTEARRSTRQLLWAICERCSPLISALRKDHADIAAQLFADFLIDNIELIQKVEKGIKEQHFPELSVLQEAEEKATDWRP